MMKVQLPLTKEQINNLRAGDQLLLNGEIYTARDAAHKRLIETIEAGKPLPFEIKDAIIYYVGPSQAAPGKIYGSCGPTTSTRMDSYTPTLLSLGMQGCIGKGKREASVTEALMKYHGLYLVTIGGLGALLQKCVTKVEPVCYDDLGPEAINRLTVKDFPVYVGIDTLGNNIYD